MVDKTVDVILAKLRGLYVQAKELAESEARYSHLKVLGSKVFYSCRKKS
jgi:hypothetical protein